MPRFTFRLERVLEQRLSIERERQRVVAELERERLGAESHLRAAQGAIASGKVDLRDALTGSAERALDLRWVRTQAHASLHLTLRAQQAAIRLSGIHARLAAARASLLEAAKARKAVETLKTRRREQWEREERRRETLAADEMAVIAEGRKAAARISEARDQEASPL